MYSDNKARVVGMSCAAGCGVLVVAVFGAVVDTVVVIVGAIVGGTVAGGVRIGFLSPSYKLL